MQRSDQSRSANPHHGLVLVVLAIFAFANSGCGEGESSQDKIEAREKEDLIVFVAREKPTLYRLVGTKPLPWGTASFNNPASIVADSKKRCFFVLDRPRYIYQPIKVWRVEADGKASVIFEGERGKDGRPFSWLLGLMLDKDGKLLIADGTSGLWHLDNDGKVQQLFEGASPFREMSAEERLLLFAVDKWTDDTLVVADPDKYVKGVSGTGGLFLFGPDGKPQVLAAFGDRIKPVDVAVLRQVGKSPAPAAAKRGLGDAVGVHRAGRITKVSSASYERQSQSPHEAGSPLYGLGRKWEEQPQDVAISRLRALFEGARWEIKQDGTFLFSPSGVDPQNRTHPLALKGSANADGRTVLAHGRYSPQSNFDLKSASLDATMQSARKGELTVSVEVTVSGDDERLKARFEQPLRIEAPDER